MAETVVATIVIDEKAMTGIALMLRVEMAEIVRDFASREAGPVGERLRQIADVFEGVS